MEERGKEGGRRDGREVKERWKRVGKKEEGGGEWEGKGKKIKIGKRNRQGKRQGGRSGEKNEREERRKSNQ